MKKLSIVMTLFILAAMVLAACTTSGPSIPATGSNTSSTPAAAVTGTSTTAATTPSASAGQTTATSAAPMTTATQPAVTSTTAAQPTAAATGTSAAPTSAATATSPAASAQSTATAPASTAATAQATSTSSAGTGTGSSAATTATPSASANGTPQAGVNQAQYVRLSSLMTLSVQTNDQKQVGTVNSVVVERPTVAAGSSANSSTVNASTPYVRYVVVDVAPSASGSGSSASNGNQVFIPWQAFTFNGLALGSSSTGQSASNNVLTLNFPMTAFTGAPRFDVTQVQNGSMSNWQSQSSQYWTSQGLSIPATGANASQPANLVVIGKEMNGFNIVDGNNAVLGQVADFLVDTNTGAVAYAVISAQILNGQTFFVPLTHLNWNFPVGQNTLNNLGNLVINITPAILQQAPSFGSLNNLQLNQNWIQQLNQFWNSIPNTQTK